MTPPGRPEVGRPINVRLGDDLLAAVDAKADELGITRAARVRSMVAAADAELDDETIEGYR